jgi:hypothetical protein
MWEYRIEQIDMPPAKFGDFSKLKAPEQGEYQLLAELGKHGWELVSAVPMSAFGNSKQMRFYFKRYQPPV